MSIPDLKGRSQWCPSGLIVAACIMAAGCSPIRQWGPHSETTSAEAPDSGLVTPFDPQAPPVWEKEWGAASSRALAEGKLVLAFFTGSDWCKWCKMLQREVFDRAEFAQWAQQNFVLLRVDFPRYRELPSAEAEAAAELARQYEGEIKGYPTVLFLSPDGQLRGKVGYVSGGPGAWIRAAEGSLHGAPSGHSRP